MDLPGTARMPFLLLETIKDLEGEHLRVAKGRSSPSNTPCLAPLEVEWEAVEEGKEEIGLRCRGMLMWGGGG